MEMLLLMTEFETHIWAALVLFFIVLIYGWAKGVLGSAKLAILFAIIVVYLTFYQHPELIWIVVFVFIFATFGKEIISKMHMAD